MSSSYPPPPEGGDPRRDPQAGEPYGEPGYGTSDYGQGGYAAPAYGQGGQAPAGYGSGGYGPPASPRNGLGWAALIVGIIALLASIIVIGAVLGVVLGIVAIVLGVMARRRVKRGEATNGGAAIAGIVLGALGLLLGAAILALGAFLFNQSEFQNLTECLQSAGNDQAAVEQCRQDFESEVGQ